MSTKYIVNNLTGQTINGQSIDPKYKVFTALLTQSGGDDVQYINWDDDPNTLTVGVTYTIEANDDSSNFIPNGAPNNNVGTSFVATSSVVSWGEGNTGDNQVSYNTGAPVATVLENTIGNVWFTYSSNGYYGVFTNGLLTDKISVFIGARTTEWYRQKSIDTTNYTNSSFYLSNINNNGTSANNILQNTPIEIRVYN